MASQIIAFILSYWEDILITLSVGVVLLLFDTFVLRKRHSEGDISNDLIATDRIITYLVIMDLVIFFLFWYRSAPGDYIWVWGFMVFQVPFLIIVGLLLNQREKCIKGSTPPRTPPS